VNLLRAGVGFASGGEGGEGGEGTGGGGEIRIPPAYSGAVPIGVEHAMMDEATDYLDRIVQDPAILGGRPAVRGTRIPVEVVLEYLASNPDFEEFFADYPRLTLNDVKACLGYAAVQVATLPHREASATQTAP
jgi:uncharacterized protein (DUF433 family)